MKTLGIYTSQTGFTKKYSEWLVMKMFVKALKNKKNATEDEKRMVEGISQSYDISDIKYLDPVMDYLGLLF